MRTQIETVTVVLGSGAVCRPVIIWRGTRTRLEDRLVAGFDRYPARPHAIDAAQTKWKSAHDLPVGALITTAPHREPTSQNTYVVTRTGLTPISYDQAWDRLDPKGAAERAADREHDARADAAKLPRTLTRFVGVHALVNGLQWIGNSLAYAERCTARQAYWRRATRTEAEAFEEATLRNAFDTFEAGWAGLCAEGSPSG